MITDETYLRILRDRLEEAGVDSETVDRTISREKATIAGVPEEDVASLFTEQRLAVLISSAKRRSENAAKKKTANAPDNTKEMSILATQDSQTLTLSEGSTLAHEDKTVNVARSLDEEKTVIPSRLEVPPALLESDTATVIISRPVIPPKNITVNEDATVAADSFGKSGMEKLLSDHATIRISEKDTVQFLTNIPEDQTATLSSEPTEDKTNVIPLGLTDDITDKQTALPSLVADKTIKTDRMILSFLDEAHDKKKNEREDPTPKTDGMAVITLSEDDLKNTHPIGLFFAILVVVFPFFVTLASLYAVIFFITLLTLSVMTVFPIAVYTLTVSGSGGGILYGSYRMIRYLCENDAGSIVPSIVILTVSLSVFILSLLFLHRPVLSAYVFFKKRMTAFWRKNGILCRNTLRYFIKSLRFA